MKCKCKCDVFNIFINSDCDDCEYNGSYTEHSGYIYTELPKGAIRDQTIEEGECKMGSSFDEGCYFFTCTECGASTNLPVRSDI